MKLDPTAALPVSFALRSFVSRCLAHPDLSKDPIAVLANERDKMLDALDQSWVDQVEMPPRKLRTK